MAASAPARESTRYDELEAYRGVAALLIVVFHAYQHSRAMFTYVYQGTPINVVLQNLDATVAWFFVLSGFLITLPFARAMVRQDQAQSTRGFLIRRAIRIVPLYYTAILIVWTLRYTGGPGQWQDLGLHLSFTQVFNRTHIFWTIGPAWSLAVEAQFYLGIALLAPLAFRACRRLSSANARLALLGMGTLLFAATSLAYKWWALNQGHIADGNYPVYYGPVAKMDTFAFGVGLALVVTAVGKKPLLGGIVPTLARLAGLAILAADFLLRQHYAWVNLYFHTISGLGFTLFLASTVLAPRGTWWERFLNQAPLQFLGLISYSIYMWHEPIMIWLADQRLVSFETLSGFPLAALTLVMLSVLAGSISYWMVEYPISMLRYVFTRSGHLVDRYAQARVVR